MIQRGLNAGAILIFSNGNVIPLTLNMILPDDDCILATPCGCVSFFCYVQSTHVTRKMLFVPIVQYLSFKELEKHDSLDQL